MLSKGYGGVNCKKKSHSWGAVISLNLIDFVLQPLGSVYLSYTYETLLAYAINSWVYEISTDEYNTIQFTWLIIVTQWNQLTQD